MLRQIKKAAVSLVLLLTIGAAESLAGDLTEFNTMWLANSYYPIWNSVPENDLDVGESVTKTIYASKRWNNTGIHLRKDRKYKFTVASPGWNNGLKETDAGGYNDTNPYASLRRHTEYKTMALVGEIHTEATANPTTYTGTKFLIGLGRASYTAARSGYLVAIANDCIGVPPYDCYLDNSRVVTLTVKRLE